MTDNTPPIATFSKWFGFVRTKPFIRPRKIVVDVPFTSYRREVTLYELLIPMAVDVGTKWQHFHISIHTSWDRANLAADFLSGLQVSQNAQPCAVFKDHFHPSGISCECEV